ncbi:MULTISPECIES: class II aldolase/adducin family protein [Rheinheimera]|uniref:Class II aldolase/adducin family protein n=1 Tax=Rheinheimera marina TaxID=1774958 RepID=A0ABV9JG74_9GAMM
MHEQEGVIKFQLNFQPAAVLTAGQISEINAWRTLLHQLGMLGQHPKRYDNYGFGNLSQRSGQNEFMISGTQTGGPLQLQAADYALVTKVDIGCNQLWACGDTAPSSESMTHAAIYQADARVQVVVHAHCPAIWQQTAALQLPHTSADIPYGTVEMALAVQQLVCQQGDAPALFTMLGHEDGVVSYGRSFTEAVSLLCQQYAKALALGAAPNLR